MPEKPKRPDILARHAAFRRVAGRELARTREQAARTQDRLGSSRPSRYVSRLRKGSR